MWTYQPTNLPRFALLSIYLLNLSILTIFISGCSGSYTGTINSEEPTTQKLLTISPLTKTVGLGGTLSFDASGGSEPYSFEVYYGSGSITSAGATGTYQAPLSEGAAVIRVQDKSGDTGYATVEIADSPVIQPSVKTLAVGNRFPFSVLSGKAPYVFSIVSGEGSINAATGEFVAGSNAGSAVIRVTDADNRTAEAAVTISGALSFSSNNVYVEKNATSTLSATGGVAPYSYLMASGAGSVNKTTGVYTAPSALGTSTVHVFDSLGNVDLAVMNITTALSISPSNALIAKNSNLTFSGVGGVPPYSYSVVAGGTCIASTVVSGQYAAPSITCSNTIRVTDALGHTSDASVTVTNNLSFSVSHLILAVGNSVDVSTIVTGGVAPLTYTVPSSQGLLLGSTYTAPNTPGLYSLTVSDSQPSTPNSITTTVLVNSSLSLLPATATVAAGTQKRFSAFGGVPPYAYSMQSGTGQFTEGLYTAPSTTGNEVLLVTDARGNTATATVSVQNPLTLTPLAKTLNTGESFTFQATGGNSPYTFSLLSGSGAINPSESSTVYTAPGSPGLATLRLQDDLGNRKDALITIINPLSISPPTISLVKNGTITFTASGGVGPYVFSLVSGGLSIDPSTGAYAAAATTGTSTVRVTDSLGSIKDATITIYDGLTISPFTKSLAVNQAFIFTANGGVTPYSFSKVSGVGDINGSTGSYSSSTAGSAIVRVTDGAGNTSDATISVNSALAIAPTSITLSVNNSYTFSASGGVPPYGFSKVSGNGDMTNAGDYHAPSASTTALVRVTDANNTSADATITVNDAIAISPSTATVAAGGTQSFTVTGGVGGYTYTASGGGSFTATTYTAPSVAGGASVSILVRDSLGNTASATITVPPITVTIGSPNSSAFVTDSNKAAFTVSGTCSESGRMVVVSASDGTNAAVTASPTCSSGTWTTNLNLTSLNDVAITITANHSNTNSVAATPATVTVTKDGGVPTITITAPSASSYVGNSITVTGACSESGRAVNLSATGSITAITTCSSGSYSSTLVYPNSTTDGAITITATHSDSAGNAATPATVNVTKDSVAPVISAFAITNSSPTNTTTFNLTSTITDASAITFYCILINATDVTGCTWTSGSLPSSIVISPATSGDKTLSAWVKDAAGNISVRRNSNLVTLDLVVPTITISVPAASAYVNASNVSAYSVSGTCNKEGGSVNIKAGSTSVGTATCTSNAWSTSTADFSAIAEGSISLTAVLTDLASNTATSSAVSITKDVTAPSGLAITNDGVWMNSTSTSPGISFTAATDATSGILKHQIQIVLGSDITTVLKTWADFNSTGSTVTSLSLTEGVLYKVQMKAIDNASNTSIVVTSTDGWTVDTTAPSTPGSVNDGTTGSDLVSSPVLSWTASSDSGGINYYEVAIGTTAGGTDISTWTSVTNVTSTTVSGLTLNAGITYYASVRAKDLAGNTSLVGQGDGWISSAAPSGTCPSGYILVPALAGYTTSDFCVAKYEMKNNSGAKSEAAGTPWVSIARGTDATTAGAAWKACKDLGAQYDLISNAQWQTIARNIADTASNWSSGIVYSGELNSGHTDGTPANTLAASNDNDACYGTGQTCSDTTWNSQRRTNTLSNGNVIWDLGGNNMEWVKDNQAGLPGSTLVSNFNSGDSRQIYFGNDTFCATPASTPYCGMGMGDTHQNGQAIGRGSSYSALIDVFSSYAAGIFTSNLYSGPTVTIADRTFRCVYAPNPSVPGFVDDGTMSSLTSSPTVAWTASTVISGSITAYEIAIGTTAGGTQTKDWTSVGNVTSASLTTGLSLTTGITYYASVRAIDNSGTISPAGVGDGFMATTSGTCPTGYISVPPLAGYTTSPFCVAKYEMKNNSGAKSEAAGNPWASIPRGTDATTAGGAWKACKDLGAQYDLISNAQWQTIARNIADQATNWSTGTVYSGELSRGHSDGTPNNSLAASTDADGCNGTGQTCSNTTWNSQRRTHTLSNGNVIWDFAGNVWEWVKDNNSSSQGADGYLATFNGGDSRQTNYGNDSFCASPSATPYCGMGYGYTNYSAGAVYRGGTWNDVVLSGIFAANLPNGPTLTHSNVGFRCVFSP